MQVCQSPAEVRVARFRLLDALRPQMQPQRVPGRGIKDREIFGIYEEVAELRGEASMPARPLARRRRQGCNGFDQLGGLEQLGPFGKNAWMCPAIRCTSLRFVP